MHLFRDWVALGERGWVLECRFGRVSLPRESRPEGLWELSAQVGLAVNVVGFDIVGAAVVGSSGKVAVGMIVELVEVVRIAVVAGAALGIAAVEKSWSAVVEEALAFDNVILAVGLPDLLDLRGFRFRTN